jgi:hypothetical protein
LLSNAYILNNFKLFVKHSQKIILKCEVLKAVKMLTVTTSDMMLGSLAGGYVLEEHITSTFRAEVTEIAGP